MEARRKCFTISLSPDEMKRVCAAACVREMELDTYMVAAILFQSDQDLARRNRFEIDPHERRPVVTHGVASRRRGRS